MKDHRPPICPRGGNGRSSGSLVPPVDGALSAREQRAIERAEVEKRLRADTRTALNEARDELAATREDLAQARHELVATRAELKAARRDRDPDRDADSELDDGANPEP